MCETICKFRAVHFETSKGEHLFFVRPSDYERISVCCPKLVYDFACLNGSGGNAILSNCGIVGNEAINYLLKELNLQQEYLKICESERPWRFSIPVLIVSSRSYNAVQLGNVFEITEYSFIQ